MLRRQIAGSVFVVSSSSFRSYERQRSLSIGSYADPSADFAKRWRSFVHLDVDVGIFE